jgi:hypothetical protein
MFLDKYGAWRQRVADYGRIYGVQYQSYARCPYHADRTISMNYSTGGETAGKRFATPRKEMAPQVGLEPTTLRLTAGKGKNLSAVSSVAYRGVHPKSRPQLGYDLGYTYYAKVAKSESGTPSAGTLRFGGHRYCGPSALYAMFDDSLQPFALHSSDYFL